jgi:hypothetical protein
MVLRRFDLFPKFVFELDDRELNSSCIYSFIRPPRILYSFPFIVLCTSYFPYQKRLLNSIRAATEAQRNNKNRTQKLIAISFQFLPEAHRKCIAKEIKSEQSFNLNR